MKLNEIQQALKVPKNHKNSFGGYNYRNAEDILEAVKPLLGDSVLTLTDEVVNIGDRYYVKATAEFCTKEHDPFHVTAYAREEETKKGMDGAQITGAASSYARKYALNGLFLIDDTKDADSEDNSAVDTPPKALKQPRTNETPKDDPRSQLPKADVDVLKMLVVKLGLKPQTLGEMYDLIAKETSYDLRKEPGDFPKAVFTLEEKIEAKNA